jgi:hypothetical protein
MHAQEASDLTAEKQLAQRKAELDAREKALDRREKKLAEKEKATASSTSRSREEGKARAKHQQTIAQSTEEQTKAARAEKKLHEPFAQRLGEAFLEQLGTAAYTPPEPGATPTPRRIPPAPFDSPPFPSADWQIGGTQIIGDPGELPPYPLMQAIYEGPGGQAWKDSKVQIYGWVNFSGNISTSHPSNKSENGNFPLIYDLRPNRMELNRLFSTSSGWRMKIKRITSIGVFESQPSTGSTTDSQRPTGFSAINCCYTTATQVSTCR